MSRNEWYQSIPTFMNQTPRTLQSFHENELFKDLLFPNQPSSLVGIDKINELKIKKEKFLKKRKNY